MTAEELKRASDAARAAEADVAAPRPARQRVPRLPCGCEEREGVYPVGSLCDVGEWLLQDKNALCIEQGAIARGEAMARPGVNYEWLIIRARIDLTKHVRRAWIDPGSNCSTQDHADVFGECHRAWRGGCKLSTLDAWYAHHRALERMKPRERAAFLARCSSKTWRCEVPS